MTATRKVLNKCAKLLLLNGRHVLKEMQQLVEVEGDVGYIQLHTLVFIINGEYKVAFSEAEGSKLLKLLNMVKKLCAATP